MLTGLERPKAPGWFLAAGLLLGIGWYTYISSLVMMPIYVMISIGTLVWRKRDWRESAALVAGFVIPVTLFAIWIVAASRRVSANRAAL